VPPEFLSVTPQRLRCYVCGTFTESPNGWSYRIRLRGHSPVCPSCRSKVEQEIEQQTSSPNLLGAVLLGAVVAAVVATAWYGVTVVLWPMPTFEAIGIAVGIGWLVGKAVVLGSGNKRGPSLQWAAGALAGGAVLGGQYLTLNHLVSKLAGGGPSGWLHWKQFFILLGRLTTHGKGFDELLLLAAAISCGFVLPCADKLLSESPRNMGGWLRLLG